MRKLVAASIVSTLLFSSSIASAAIIYGDNKTSQASFAASTTAQIGTIVNDVVSGSLSASTTSNTSGIVSGIGHTFATINTWLKEKAGIDFFGILKGIGHFFLVVIEFVVDFVKKVL